MRNARYFNAVIKFARAPKTLASLAVDKVFVPFWLRIQGIQVGARCRFQGTPTVRRPIGATIRLGDGVVLRSRPDSNVAGDPHRTIIAALSSTSLIELGANTKVTGASIVAERAVVIGERVLVGAGACIWDTDFHPLDATQRRRSNTAGAASGPVTIGDDAFIGARSIILKGVTVGARSVIGAGAVVTRNVEADTTVAGNPAVVTHKRAG